MYYDFGKETARGYDVSEHNGKIDWQSLKTTLSAIINLFFLFNFLFFLFALAFTAIFKYTSFQNKKYITILKKQNPQNHTMIKKN